MPLVNVEVRMDRHFIAVMPNMIESLAEAWDCSERKVDRLRKSGVLGEPVGRIGRTDLYSNAQKQAAERAGLAGHQVEAEAP